jgi:hypothetical protein
MHHLILLCVPVDLHTERNVLGDLFVDSGDSILGKVDKERFYARHTAKNMWSMMLVGSHLK